MRERILGGPAPAEPPRAPARAGGTTTAERILGVLACVPTDPHSEARALSLVRSYHSTALLAVRGLPAGPEVEQVVEDYRLVLLQLLAAVTEPVDGPQLVPGFDPTADREAGQAVIRRYLAKKAELRAAEQPRCPKCGGPMTGGAPHGPWPTQWECHRCGTVVVPPSQRNGKGVALDAAL